MYDRNTKFILQCQKEANSTNAFIQEQFQSTYMFLDNTFNILFLFFLHMLLNLCLESKF